jgi:hypothetical protein
MVALTFMVVWNSVPDFTPSVSVIGSSY